MPAFQFSPEDLPPGWGDQFDGMAPPPPVAPQPPEVPTPEPPLAPPATSSTSSAASTSSTAPRKKPGPKPKPPAPPRPPLPRRPPPSLARRQILAAAARASVAINSSILSTLIDRLEVAIAAARIDLLADDGPATEVAITTGELAVLFQILFPEEFPAEGPAPPATRTAPGSMARVEEYSRRVESAQQLFAAGDARADGLGRGVRVASRANGSGPKVVGWEDEDAADDGAAEGVESAGGL